MRCKILRELVREIIVSCEREVFADAKFLSLYYSFNLKYM